MHEVYHKNGEKWRGQYLKYNIYSQIFILFLSPPKCQSDNNKQLLSSYCLPGTVLRALDTLIHLVLIYINPTKWVVFSLYRWEKRHRRLNTSKVIQLLSGRVKSESEVAQSCLTFCDPVDCSLPDSSVHGIFQALVLEWIAISFSRGSSQPRDRTRLSCIVDRRFTVWVIREVIL